MNSLIKIFVVASLVFSQSAFSSDPFSGQVKEFSEGRATLEKNSGESKFQVLLNWFKVGQPIRLEELKGFYSGRCFNVDQKNTPRNIFLGYLERSETGDAGPGFPDDRVLKFAALIRGSAEASYFDNNSKFLENRADFVSKFNKVWKYVSVPSEDPTLNYTIDLDPRGSPDEKVVFKRYDGYILSTTISLSGGVEENPWTRRKLSRKPGFPSTVCYLFKKLGD